MKGSIFTLALLGALAWAWIYAGGQQAKIVTERREARQKCEQAATNYEPVWLKQKELDRLVSDLTVMRDAQIQTQQDAVTNAESYEQTAKGIMFSRKKDMDIGGFLMGGNTDKGRKASEQNGQLTQSIDNLSSATVAREQARTRLEKISFEGYQNVTKAQQNANQYRNKIGLPLFSALEKECNYVDDMKQMKVRFAVVD